MTKAITVLTTIIVIVAAISPAFYTFVSLA